MVTLSPSLTDNLSVEQFVQNVRNSQDVLLQNYASTCLKDPTTVFHQAFTKQLVSQANKQINQFKNDKNKKLQITCKLTIEEKKLLVESWPEFHIEFLDTSYESHAMAHASRICEQRKILIDIGYFKDNTNKKIKVIDVGGNPIPYANGGMSIHSCCPILNSKDSARNSFKNMELNTLLRCKSNKYDKDHYFCNYKSELCNIKCDKLIFLHSTYDMSSNQIADIMERKGAAIAYGSMIFTPEILYRNSGFIPHLKLHWEKFYHGKIRRKLKIKFYFEGDLGEIYEHDFDNYTSILRSFIQSSDKTSGYHIELSTRLDCSILMFRILKNTYPVKPQYSSFNVWKNVLVNYVVVPCYEYDLTFRDNNPRKHITKKNIICPTEFYERLKGLAMLKTAANFSVENIISASVSINTRVIVNGNVVVPKNSLTTEEIALISTNIFLSIYINRWCQGKVIETIVSEIKQVRDKAHKGILSGLYDRLLATFKAKNVGETTLLDKFTKLLQFRVIANYFDLEPNITPQTIKIDTFIDQQLAAPGVTNIFDDIIIPIDDDVIGFKDINIDGEDSEARPYHENIDGLSNAITILKSMDGNCLYDSIIATTTAYSSLTELKKKLLESPSCLRADDRNEVNEELKSNKSISTINSIVHANHNLPDYQINLHTPESSIRFIKYNSINNHLKQIHIYYNNNHYSPIFQTDIKFDDTLLTDILPTETTDTVIILDKTIDKSRISYVSPTKVGYSYYNSLEIQEIFYNKGLPKTVFLSNCYNNSGTSGILQYLMDTDIDVYSDTSFTDNGEYKSFALDKLSNYQITTAVPIIEDIIVEKFDADSFEKLFLFANQNTRFIVLLNYNHLYPYNMLTYLSKRFFNIEVHRSNFSPLNSTVYYLICTGISLSDVTTEKFSHLDELYKKIRTARFKNFSNCHTIQHSNSNTMRLEDDDLAYIIYKYLKPRTIRGAGIFDYFTKFRPIKFEKYSDKDTYLKNDILYYHNTEIIRRNIKNRDISLSDYTTSDYNSVTSEIQYSDSNSEVPLIINTPPSPRNIEPSFLQPSNTVILPPPDITKYPLLEELTDINNNTEGDYNDEFDQNAVALEPFNRITSIIPDQVFLDHLENKSFSFPYVSEDTEYSTYYNALIEYIYYLKISHTILAKNLRFRYDSIVLGTSIDNPNKYIVMNPNLIERECAVYFNGICLYNTTGIENFAYHYQCKRDDNNKIIFEGFIVPTEDMKGLSIADKNCEKLLEPTFYNKLKHLIETKNGKININTDFKYHLFNGVPGCGKTTKIIQMVQPNDVVLFPTIESKLDFIERLKRDRRDDNNFIIDDNNYLTTMSFLCKSQRNVNRVFIDEARMMHPGVAIAVATKSKCKTLYMFGDKAQIPFINRTPIINMKYTSLDDLFNITQTMYTSHRCPRDITRLFTHCYDNSFETTSPVEDSLIMRPDISNDEQLKDHLRNIKYDTIMVFTQSEKKDLIKLGTSEESIKIIQFTNTVNEYQGKQCKNSLIVRTNTKPGTPIYLDEAQVLVAMTRHTITCTYINYAKIKDKITEKMIEASNYKLVNNIGIRGAGIILNEEYKIDNSSHKLSRKKLYSEPGKYDYGYVTGLIKQGIDKFDIDHLKSIANVDRFLMSFKHLNFSFNRNTVTSDKLEQLNKYENLLPFIPTPIERYEEIIPINLDQNFYAEPSNIITTDISYLQYCHDLVFGPAPDMSYDQIQVETSDVEYFVDNVSISLSKMAPEFSEYSYLTPRLRTNCPFPATATQREVLYSLIKRNFAVPELQTLTEDPNIFSDKLLSRFKHVYFEDHNEKVYSIIGFNKSLILEWLETQPSTSLPNDNVLEPLALKTLNQYDVTVKRTPKVTAEKGSTNVYPALQTICFQGSFFNCLFCPVIKEIRKRFMTRLKHKFKIFTDMSTQDFETTINGFYDKLKGCYSTEIDMKKYDKSQDKLMLAFECKLFSYFGMDDELVKLWFEIHRTSILYDRTNKIKTRCVCQRKSGDAATFFGNTVVLMTVLMTVYRMEDCELAMFAGDDSIIFSKELYEDKTNELAYIFNLESKLFHFQNFYFCSKFIIFTEFSTYVIPDPVKLMIKLGRHDIRNFEHLKEYVISLRDLTQCYSNPLVNECLNYSIYDRYDKADIPDLHMHLLSIIQSDAIYEMFYQEENTILFPITNNISQGKLD